MAVGDWAITTDFWLVDNSLYSQVKVNTMLANAWRLLAGGLRIPADSKEADHVIGLAGSHRIYGFWFNDHCPWDRILVKEKIKTNAEGGANLTLTVTLSVLGLVRSDTLNCYDYYADYTWITVYDGSIAAMPAWARGMIVDVFWQPTGSDSCEEVRVRCGHVMLYSSKE